MVKKNNLVKAKILISGCLLGQRVRYDGNGKEIIHPALMRWFREGRLVAVCPEVDGGLPVPRPPSEIQGQGGGQTVLSGKSSIKTVKGQDVTKEYLSGAYKALAAAKESGCKFALLTDGSPSCGSTKIYDGSFSGQKIKGEGVTTTLLRRHGIKVFAHDQIDCLDQAIRKVENKGPFFRQPG